MHKRDIIVIGASNGGVEALPKLLQKLPANLPASIFVTLHVTANAPSFFPKLLERHCQLKAAHAVNGEPIRPRNIYVAPPDRHLVLEKDSIRLSIGPKENRHRPAVDPMFRSAAKHFGPRVVGMILTGALDDGSEGLLAVNLSEALPQREILSLTRRKSVDEDPLASLTRKEKIVLQLAAEGNNNTEIAKQLFLSPRTIESHRASLMRKLKLRTQTDIVRFAIRKNIVSA